MEESKRLQVLSCELQKHLFGIDNRERRVMSLQQLNLSLDKQLKKSQAELIEYKQKQQQFDSLLSNLIAKDKQTQNLLQFLKIELKKRETEIYQYKLICATNYTNDNKNSKSQVHVYLFYYRKYSRKMKTFLKTKIIKSKFTFQYFIYR